MTPRSSDGTREYLHRDTSRHGPWPFIPKSGTLIRQGAAIVFQPTGSAKLYAVNRCGKRVGDDNINTITTEGRSVIRILDHGLISLRGTDPNGGTLTGWWNANRTAGRNRPTPDPRLPTRRHEP